MRLHFTQGLVVVTNRRLMSKGVEEPHWRDWSYKKDLVLRRHDYAGVGSLELHDNEARLTCWRYTLGHNTFTLRLIEHFDQQLAGFLAGHPVTRPAVSICPSCKAPLPPDQEECPICTREVHVPPSTWTLFRLWRFAKPYNGQLLAGFLLMLAP